MADISQVKLPNGDTYNLVDETSGYIKNYTETDPVFSASAAAGITSTDISNWNAKVSDDKTWKGVQLNTSSTPTAADTYYIPSMSGIFDTEAKLLTAVITPTARKIPLYDSSAYLKSTTPSANDNSTKVATTAYVDSAVGGITVPTKISDLTNDSGFITSYTDEKVKTEYASNDTYYLVLGGNTTNASIKYIDTDALRYQKTNQTSTLFLGTRSATNSRTGELTFYRGNYYKSLTPQPGITQSGTIYLPDANGTIALTSDIPQVYSSTNTGGYLTMATLPIYDGTVE